MKPESFRVWTMRQIVDIANVIREFDKIGGIVMTTFAELVVGLEDVGGDVPCQYGLDEADIFVIGDPAAVVDLRTQVVEHFVRDIFVFIQ